MPHLKDIAKDTSTNASGHALRLVLEPAIVNNSTIEISLKGLLPLSTSFLNSAIGELIEKYGFDTFKKHIRFTDMNPPAANAIRSYLKSCSISI